MYKLSNIEKYYLGTEILFFLEDSFRWSVCVVSIRYMSKAGRRLLGRGIVTPMCIALDIQNVVLVLGLFFKLFEL